MRDDFRDDFRTIKHTIAFGLVKNFPCFGLFCFHVP